MSDTVPSGMVNKTPSEVCQVAADYWASKAMACEESARLSIEQAERQEHEAAIYRHTEQQWRDSKAAIDALFADEAGDADIDAAGAEASDD